MTNYSDQFDCTRAKHFLIVLCLLFLPTAKAQQSVASAITVTSTANYAPRIAPDSLATIFGSSFAQKTVVAQLGADGNLPTTLSGIAVEVNGRRAALFFVSPGQVNIHVPAATETGTADISVLSDTGAVIARGQVEVQPAVPALFSSDGSGRGPAAVLNGITYRGAPFDVQTSENPGTDKRTRLALFGTGLRFAPAALSRYEPKANVASYVKVSGRSNNGKDWDLPVEYAGPAPVYVGLDQINVVIPPELDGIGELDVSTSIGDIVSNRVGIIVRNSVGPEITAITPAALPPGGAITISGQRFATSRTEAQTRSRLVFVLPSGQELTSAPEEINESSMRTHVLPFPVPGGSSWYTGQVRVCADVDERRVCAAQGLTITAPVSPPSPTGTLLTETVRRAQSAALNSLQLAGSTALASSVQALAEAKLRDLQGMIADAVAGRPRILTIQLPDGPHTVTIDAAFLSRIESILAATQGDLPQVSDRAPHSTAKMRAQASVTVCQLPEEQKRIAAQIDYANTETLDAALDWALFAGSSVALSSCVYSGGALCAGVPAELVAAEYIAVGVNVVNVATRIVLSARTNVLDTINITDGVTGALLPSLKLDAGSVYPIRINGIFKSSTTKVIAREVVQQLGEKILEKIVGTALDRVIPKGKLDDLKIRWVSDAASVLFDSISDSVFQAIAPALDASEFGKSVSVPMGAATLAVTPTLSPTTQLKLACQDSVVADASVQGLSSGGPPQIFTVAATDAVLWAGDYPPERSIVVRVTPPQVALADLQISTTRFAAGQTGSLTITLTRPAAVGTAIVLSCDSASFTLPCTITIPAGQTSIVLPVTMLRASSTPNGSEISASYGGRQFTVSFLVNPAPNTLSSLSVNPGTVGGGSSATGTIVLGTPAPVTGVDVQLRSSSSVVQTPATVRIRAGFTTGSFEIKTSSGVTAQTATITAVLGSVSRTASLAVSGTGSRGVDVVSVTTNKSTYVPGESITVTYVVRNNTTTDSGPFRNGIAGWFLPARTGFITFRGMASIPPGGQASDSVTFQLSAQDPLGTYKVRVTADYYDAVAVESSNPNSVGEASFTVKATP